MKNEKIEYKTIIRASYARKVQPRQYESEELGAAISEKFDEELSPEEKLDKLAKNQQLCFNLTKKQLANIKRKREEKNADIKKEGDKFAKQLG